MYDARHVIAAAMAAPMKRTTPSRKEATHERIVGAAARRIKEMIDLVARQSPDWGQPGSHENALVTVATMVGALLLARAVDDPKLSDALRNAALNHLVPTGA